MTNADIVNLINEQAGFSKAESDDLLDQLLEIIKDTLIKGEKIKIADFGNFNIQSKTDHEGHNPQTGETITIKARHVLTFKPNSILKAAINK